MAMGPILVPIVESVSGAPDLDLAPRESLGIRQTNFHIAKTPPPDLSTSSPKIRRSRMYVCMYVCSIMAMHPMGMGRYYALAKYILPQRRSQECGWCGSAALPARGGDIPCQTTHVTVIYNL
jgi:hypothetical protein